MVLINVFGFYSHWKVWYKSEKAFGMCSEWHYTTRGLAYGDMTTRPDGLVVMSPSANLPRCVMPFWTHAHAFSLYDVIIFDFWSVDSPFNIAALASVIFHVPNYYLFEPFYVWKIKCTEIIYALWWPAITRKVSSVGTPWWRHQMETFSELLVLCKGKSPLLPLNSPYKVQWCEAFFDRFSLICTWKTIEQTIETPVIWDAIALIVTSL